MARILISSVRDDLVLVRDVQRWLAEAGHEVCSDQDPRVGIEVGQAWRKRLGERLGRADAVVCVVTVASVASSRCTAEIAMAQARGSRLLPLRAEPDADHPLLTDVHHIELAQDPVAARAALIAALDRVDAARGWPPDRSPFPGLLPFESGHHRVFFGRADEIKQLTELMRATTEAAALLVMGPSGCGKSSLARAGLLPVMAAEPGWRTLPAILPGADPVAALARELTTAARRFSLGWTVEEVEQRLDGGGLTPLADELLLAGQVGPQRRLLVVVDQLEELLTQTPPAQRARFAELLRPALTGPVRVVATLRPEFLDQLLADSGLADLPTDIFALRPLRREALRLVIEGPARLAGIEVAEDLVTRLVEDTDSGEALPLLAFTLAQLAEGVSRSGRLSIARYEQLGGVQGALTRQADLALDEAMKAGSREREEVIAGLLRLVTVDEQDHPTRWRVRRDELPAPVRTELDVFVARRLLSTDTDHGAVVIGVAHEAFLSAWPPLAQAISANTAALRTRRGVEHAATEWDAQGRPRTRLWAGDQLAAAVAETGTRVELSAPAREFLHTGVRHQRHRRRRTRIVLSMLLIVALAAAGVTVWQQHVAQDQQRIATAGQLVGQAEAARSSDLRGALLLGLAAHRLHPTGETHASLVNTLATGPYLSTLTGHRGSVESMAFTPDGHTLATGSGDNTVILWDLTDPSRPQPLGRPLTGHRNTVNAVAFTPDGHTLATGSADNTTILWDLTGRTQPRQLGPPLTGHNSPVTAVALAPDGRTLATGSADNTVLLWDLTDRAQPRQLGPPLTGHTGPVTAMVLTPDSRTLITGSADHTVIRWDLADRTQSRQVGSPLALPHETVDGLSSSIAVTSDIFLALAPDGHTLATGGGLGPAILWDLTDLTQPRQLGPPFSSGLVNVVAFAPGGRMLATSGTTETMLWDLTDPTQPHPLGPPLVGHRSTVNAVAFAPDGRTLVVGSDDGTAILWNLTDPVQPRHPGPPLTGHSDTVWSVAFSPDRRTLASGSGDNTAILWDVSNPAQPHPLGPPLTGHSNAVWSVTFAPDGRTLATSGADNTVILWDLTDPAQPRQLGPPLTGHTSPVTSVTFTPDGRTLATGDSDGTVILWDVTDRTQPHRLGVPLTGHTKTVLSMTFAAHGRILATVSSDGTTIVWDVTDRAQPRRLDPPLSREPVAVWSVASSPDGRTLAIGSIATTLWDVTTPDSPRRLGPLLHSGSLQSPSALSLAFSADGRRLAVGTGDGTVELWDLAALDQVRDHAVQRACAITHGGLNRDEWHRRIPNLPHHDSCPPDGG